MKANLYIKLIGLLLVITLSSSLETKILNKIESNTINFSFPYAENTIEKTIECGLKDRVNITVDRIGLKKSPVYDKSLAKKDFNIIEVYTDKREYDYRFDFYWFGKSTINIGFKREGDLYLELKYLIEYHIEGEVFDVRKKLIVKLTMKVVDYEKNAIE